MIPPWEKVNKMGRGRITWRHYRPIWFESGG